MASRLILSQNEQKNSYGSKIKLLSPAKINLYLNITGKYNKEFHAIESIFERISLFDEISIQTTKDESIKFSCNNKILETKDNLCIRAAQLIKDKYKIPFGFNIKLKKKIPIGAGLGGGSSNAATTLIGINSLLKLKLSKKQLYDLGSKLGSDINFFLSESSFAFISGRGEQVSPFKGKKLYHLVVWPGVSLSTAKVYKTYQGKLTKFLSNVNILVYAVGKGDIALIKNSIFNALERSALSLLGELSKIKEYFNEYSLDFRVTGSGSALYAVLDKKSFKGIKLNLPKKWTAIFVQTF
ncbi:MAG: 4-(cytidine 5'-diphospho)-2-C-methyl-D-erythritol kinase [Candidatus Omnitrophica bacterium]|nr:4-(cytidine 5'-diphospho)-2-C-methyl-D-erythritol kinase [Candidatus Omnitrophota bacterium]